MDYDLFVIGAGSGGVSASRRASSHGAKVGIAEADKVGGTCVIRGCIPKKLFVYASEFKEMFEDSIGYGWESNVPKFNWSKLIYNKDKEIERLNKIYLDMLTNSNISLYKGYASFIDKNTIQVNNKKITANRFLIATGGWPSMPSIPGIDNAISSNEAFHLKDLPKKIAIVGGGYIALEFASIFNNLGSEVTLIYRREHPLAGFDSSIRTFLAEELVKKGIIIKNNTNITSITKMDNILDLVLTDSSSLKVDQVMYATGRTPNISGLQLDKVKIATKENGAIIVDKNNRTNIDNIFAIGDVTNKVNLTPVAIREGRALADNIFDNCQNNVIVDYTAIPSAVFSQPEAASVGLTEEQARSEYEVDIYLSKFNAMKNSLSGRNEKTLIKLVVDQQTNIVLGAHMVGKSASEIIQIMAIAIKAKLTKKQFDDTVALHPSTAEEFVLMREKST